MSTDALEVGRPIHQHIAANSEIDSAFDYDHLRQGRPGVAMIAAYMGDDKFQAGVRLHLTATPMATPPPSSSSRRWPMPATIRAS